LSVEIVRNRNKVATFAENLSAEDFRLVLLGAKPHVLLAQRSHMAFDVVARKLFRKRDFLERHPVDASQGWPEERARREDSERLHDVYS